ncbi:MAG: hypothetical protein ACI8XG_001372 [Congregibacter sp.]|jgi:hypothetical protein
MNKKISKSLSDTYRQLKSTFNRLYHCLVDIFTLLFTYILNFLPYVDKFSSSNLS